MIELMSSSGLSKALVGAVIGKGALIATVLAALDIQFWKALIIAGLSAAVTGGFSLLVAYFTIREMRHTRAELGDVKQKVGAANRRTDRRA